MDKDTLRTKTIGNTTIKGYLEQDPDCCSPFEDCDGIGKLILFSRGCHDHNQRIVDEFSGNPLALPLEAYEHGGISYALAGEGNFPDRQWDVSLRGYLVPDGYWLEGYETDKKAHGEKIAFDNLLKQARDIIETYNKWCAGDTWGYVVEIDGPDISMQDFDESCWGFIGQNYALEELDRVFNGAVKYVEQRTREQECWRELHVTG